MNDSQIKNESQGFDFQSVVPSIGLKIGNGVRKNSTLGSPCACSLEYAVSINDKIQPNKIDCNILGGSGVVHYRGTLMFVTLHLISSWLISSSIYSRHLDHDLAHKIIT